MNPIDAVIFHYSGGLSDGEIRKESGAIPRTWTTGEIIPDHNGNQTSGGNYVVVKAVNQGPVQHVHAQWEPPL